MISTTFFIEHTRYLKSDLLNRIANKNIYIVGTKDNLSDVIINAPFLVRLNESRYWGDCDLWINNSELTFFDDSDTYKASRIIRMPTSSSFDEMFENYSDSLKNSSYFISPMDRDVTIKASGIEHPMLYTLAAHWFYLNTNNNITLLNCSFSEKINRYYTQRATSIDKKYTPKKDEEFLKSLDRVKIEKITL